MKLDIAGKITFYRKQKGLTQERLAELVGVSAPAVSKWETRAAYPDIELLAPVARALGISVNELLSFQEKLSGGELAREEERLKRLFEEKGFAAGEEAAEALVREYPDDARLEILAASLLFAYIGGIAGRTPEKTKRVLERCRELLEQALPHADERQTEQIRVLLVSVCIQLDDTPRAGEILEQIPGSTVSVRLMYPALLLRQDKCAEAKSCAAENLYRCVTETAAMLQILIGISAREKRDGEWERLVEIMEKLYELFGIPNTGGAGERFDYYNRNGDLLRAAEALEETAYAYEEMETLFERSELLSPVGYDREKWRHSVRTTRKILTAALKGGEEYREVLKLAQAKRALARLENF